MTEFSVVKGVLTAHFASYNSPTRRAHLDQEEGEALWAACRANGFYPVSIQAQAKTPAHAKWPVFALRNKREWDASAPGIGLVAGALDAARKDPTRSPLRVPGVGKTLFLDFDIHAESRPGLDGAAVRDSFLSLPTVRRLLAEGALLRYREARGSGFVLVVRNAGDVGNTRPRYHADREHWPAIGTDEAGRERFDDGSPAGMDIIAAGGQAVCFAIHPSGAPYLWADGRSPANVHLNALPTVDAEAVARLIEEVTAALATFHLAPRSKTYAARFNAAPVRTARVTPIGQADRDWLHDTTIDLAIFDDGSDRRNFWRNAARVFYLLGDAPEAALERWADYYSPRNSSATFEKAEAEAVAQMEKPAGAKDALGPGAYLRWFQAAARGAGRQDVADRIGELMSSHLISDGKAFDSIAEADGALPDRQERKRQQKAESTTRQRFATFEQGALFTGDDDIFGEPDALPAVSGPELLAALEDDARFADDTEAMLAAHRAVNAIIREPQVADTAERLAQLRALIEDGELHPATRAEPPVRYVNGARPPVLPIPVARRDLDDIPDVPWVAYQDYCRGVVSALVGDGGVSKSARGLVECVAIVAGRPDLLGIAPEDVATDFKRTNVWYHCQEDDKDALDRRLAGVLKELNVPWSAIDGTDGFRLYMTSGVGHPLLLALETREGRVEAPAELAETVACVKQYGVGVVMLDPVQELHEVDENDNSAMAKVWASARSVAVEANASVALIAHPRKPDGASSAGHAGNMHVLRGASSQTGVARIVRTMFSLTDDEAKQLNIPPQDRGRYARIDAAKNNLALKNWRPTYIERRTVQVGANKRSTVPVPVIVHLDAGLSPAAQKIVDALVVMGPGEHDIDAVLEKAGIPLDAFDDANGHRARRIKRELFGKADKVERTTGGGTLRYHSVAGQRTPPTLSFTPKPDATGASFTPVDDEGETAADT